MNEVRFNQREAKKNKEGQEDGSFVHIYSFSGGLKNNIPNIKKLFHILFFL